MLLQINTKNPVETKKTGKKEDIEGHIYVDITKLGWILEPDDFRRGTVEKFFVKPYKPISAGIEEFAKWYVEKSGEKVAAGIYRLDTEKLRQDIESENDFLLNRVSASLQLYRNKKRQELFEAVLGVLKRAKADNISDA